MSDHGDFAWLCLLRHQNPEDGAGRGHSLDARTSAVLSLRFTKFLFCVDFELEADEKFDLLVSNPPYIPTPKLTTEFIPDEVFE